MPTKKTETRDKAILIWIDSRMAMKAKAAARANNRNLTSWVRQLITDAVTKGK